MTILVAEFSGLTNVILGTDYLCARRACIDFASRSLIFPVPPTNEFVTIPLTMSAYKSECETDNSSVSVSSIHVKPCVSKLHNVTTVNAMGQNVHQLPKLRILIPAISIRKAEPQVGGNTLCPCSKYLPGTDHNHVSTELEMLDVKFEAMIGMKKFKQPKKQRWKPDLSFP